MKCILWKKGRSRGEDSQRWEEKKRKLGIREKRRKRNEGENKIKEFR